MPAKKSWHCVLSLAVAPSTETEEAWSPVVERPSLASPRRSLSQHKRAPAGAPPREELSNVGPRKCAKLKHVHTQATRVSKKGCSSQFIEGSGEFSFLKTSNVKQSRGARCDWEFNRFKTCKRRYSEAGRLNAASDLPCSLAAACERRQTDGSRPPPSNQHGSARPLRAVGLSEGAVPG